MRRYLLLGVIIVLVCVLVVIGLQYQGSPKNSKKTMKIGVLSWVGFGPFFVAKEKGLFEKEGLDVEILKIEEAAPLREALTSGEVHGIIGTVDSFATGMSAGLPAKVILKVDDSNGSDGIVATTDIVTVKDLRGKRVAFPKGIPSHFFLLYLLKKEGVSAKEIVPEYMEAGNAAAAFMAKKVDAAVTWEPWLSKAGKAEHGHIMVTSKDHPGLIVDLFAVHSDVLKDQPEDVRRLLRGWFAALEFMEREREESCRIIGKAMGIDPKEVGGMLEGLKFASYEDNINYFTPPEKHLAGFEQVFDAAGEIWKSTGYIRTPAMARDCYDATPLKQLYE